TSFRGSDTLAVIPAARYFCHEPNHEVCINSVNASEHSVSTTKIFTVGEKQMLSDWMKTFPNGILSIVADTFDLWKLITEYLPALKDEILSRDGKLVIRPDSGNPVDIICGERRITTDHNGELKYANDEPKHKGVIELLWDIFGGIINDQGYKVLDSHIGAIYGDSITIERQEEIYERLSMKGFATTNIVLGVGSFTYQYNTRDTFGFAAKGSWFEANGVGYDIYKDPVTDDGTKKSLRGRIRVNEDFSVTTGASEEEEKEGLLRIIYENGVFKNTNTLEDIRERLEETV